MEDYLQEKLNKPYVLIMSKRLQEEYKKYLTELWLKKHQQNVQQGF